MTRIGQYALAALLCLLLGSAHAQAPASIGPIDPTLLLPVVAGLQDNQLDPETVPAQGLEVTVAGTDANGAVSLALQTTLNIYLADEAGQTLTSASFPISARNAGKPLTLPLDKAPLAANIGKTLRVYYSISGPGSASRVSGVVAVAVKEGFSAAQVLDLSKRNYVVLVDSEGTPRPPQSLPTYAHYTRVQAGAIRYSVDNNTIARADEHGQVSVWGNGEVTVTAQTAAGSTASYVLSVRGVRELRVFGTEYVTWENARRQVLEKGYRLPRYQDYEALLALYNLPPGALADTLDLSLYWVWGEWVGANTAVILSLDDNLITSEWTAPTQLGYAAGIR